MGKIHQIIKSAQPDTRAERWIVSLTLGWAASLMLISEDWGVLTPQLFVAYSVATVPLCMGLFVMTKDIIHYWRDRNGKDKDADDR